MNNEIVLIWNDLNKALINFINQKVKNLEVSRDISQDVFVKVFSKINTLKDKDKIIPWIYQITRNEINTYFRKQEYGHEIKIEDKLEILEENLTFEFSKCIQPMINSLPLKFQKAIKMTEIEGLSQKELAKSLNISYSGAKSRVQRGRELLKSLLLQCCSVSTDKYGNITEYKKNNCNNPCK